jgi:prophage antirepressor-like protein
LSIIIPQPGSSNVFDVLGHNIRFGLTGDDVAYAVASDFAKAMGHRDAANAIRLLEQDEKGTQIVSTPGGPQSRGGSKQARRWAVIYEDGLWELIFRSTLPGAKVIKKRVKAILQQIRQTGSYTAVPALPDITTPAGVLAMAEQFALTARQLVDADKRIAELEPKAIAHDTYLSAQSGERLVREVAKLLGWKQRDLRRFLSDEKLIFSREALCGDTVWDFYADHARHFRSVEHPVEHRWGRCSHYTLYIRPAGVDLIQKRIAKRKAELDAAIGGAA